MPIRFRCNCGQLLGIARRKAGATVRCPSCHNEVAVPQPDDAGTALPPPSEPAPEPGPPALFERDDFDALLQGGMSMGAQRPRGSAVRTPAPASRPQPMPPSVPVVQVEAKPWTPPVVVPPAPAPGLVLSPARATVLTVVVILLLALAFASGLIVGRFVL
jgi:hypothetical protein